MGTFNKIVKAVNKTDVLMQTKQKIDKAAKGIILTPEENKDLNVIRAEYLTATDEIAREQSKVNFEFDVKYHNCAEEFVKKELLWWENIKKQRNVVNSKTTKSS
jgi:hypothetical protein